MNKLFQPNLQKRTALVRCRPFALCYDFLFGKRFAGFTSTFLLAFAHYLRITYRRICRRFLATI